MLIDTGKVAEAVLVETLDASEFVEDDPLREALEALRKGLSEFVAEREGIISLLARLRGDLDVMHLAYDAERRRRRAMRRTISEIKERVERL